uniref:Uncharacterized protein n=1 Tax=Timema tahoe TaxID=61484 RepID=A0A7R9ITB9_9NEOP|nr:unnamed protein product [Timema tahoe]
MAADRKVVVINYKLLETAVIKQQSWVDPCQDIYKVSVKRMVEGVKVHFVNEPAKEEEREGANGKMGAFDQQLLEKSISGDKHSVLHTPAITQTQL